jgi:hypothetical protein
VNPLIKRLALALLLASAAVILATPAGAAGRGHATNTPLAGPWYTPQELKALIAYSKASFAQKKALLGGTEPGPIGVGDKVHWSDAGIGAGVALGCVFVAGAAAAVFARSRTERRRPRHT